MPEEVKGSRRNLDFGGRRSASDKTYAKELKTGWAYRRQRGRLKVCRGGTDVEAASAKKGPISIFGGCATCL